MSAALRPPPSAGSVGGPFAAPGGVTRPATRPGTLSRTDDPFYAVKDTLDEMAVHLRGQFSEWQLALSSMDTTTPEFRKLHEDFGGRLRKFVTTLDKLRASTERIEADRAKYTHVDDGELASRRAAVAALDRVATNMRETYTSRETKARMQADERKALAASTAGAGRGGGDAASDAARLNPYTRSNDAFVGAARTQLHETKREQDEVLSSMGNTLDRLDAIAHTMDSELREQGDMADHISSEMTVVQSKLDAAMEGVSKLLKTKDKCQLATIVLLVVVFIIVAIVAFYLLT